MTKYIDCEVLTNKAIEAVIDICDKMGWRNEPDANGLSLKVNVPISDTHLWDFIFEEFERSG